MAGSTITSLLAARPMATERIARRPSLRTELPPQWNSSLQQCGAAILLFALATILTQQAALGVVLLGIVRSFALLVFVAGGVMYPYSRIRAVQQARRDASQEPDVKAKASHAFQASQASQGPVTLKSFPQSVSSSATGGAVLRSQAPPPPSSSVGAAPLGIRQAHSLLRAAEAAAEAGPLSSAEAEAAAEVEAWPTSRSRLARAADADAAAFLASPPTEAAVEQEAQEGSAERASAMLAYLIEHGGPRAAAGAGAFHAVVRAHAAEGRPAQASAWLERMLATGLRPDAHVFNAAMGAHFNAAASDGGKGARALLGRMAQLQWPALRWVQGHWASQLEDIDCC